MDALSLYAIIPIILIALATMWVAGRALHIRPADGRFASIDGLRGYMAFFVFLHHSQVWYFFLRGKGWAFPPGNLFKHFGPTSVAVFFMITAFLFVSKLLQARDGRMDWLRLYVSRWLRIMPLYLFALLLLVIMVGVLTHFTLQEPAGALAFGILHWVAFIEVDLNRLAFTQVIVAGVVWSLAYEWLFYCALPFLGIICRVRASLAVVLAALTGLVFFAVMIHQFYGYEVWGRLGPFAGGILAAFLAREEKVRELVAGTMGSVCIVFLLALTVGFFPSVYEPMPLLLLTAAFIGIACGNDLFGVLTLSLSRLLGQVSYSIYLLHGMVLFVTFTWIFGTDRAARLSPLAYWGAIALCSIGLVIICSLTYRFIERPALAAAPSVTAKTRKLSVRRRKAVFKEA